MSLFVAAGHHGLILTSDDGRSWKEARLGKEGEVFRAGAAGNGRIVLAGGFGGNRIFASSGDGKTWQTTQQDAKCALYVRGFGFFDGRFVALAGDPGAVGEARPTAFFSRDGVSWEEPVSLGGKWMLRRIAAGAGRFVAVGDRGRVAHSTDLRAWTDVKGTTAADSLIDIAFGAGVFVGVGLHGLRAASADGAAWERTRGEEGEHLNAVLWTGERFVAVGQAATYVSPDGKAWTRHPVADGPLSATYGGGVFLGTAWRGRILRSEDGIAWKEVHKASQPVEAVLVK
jgi:hypothetical protein